MDWKSSVVPIPRYGHFKTFTVSSLEKSQRPVPLRILIDSDLMGAVMGRRKCTVEQIANETRTRICVDGTKRRINENILEIGLAIQGIPSNCSVACHRILNIMQKKQKQLRRNRSVKLKILMPRCYIGRIIGKECSILRTIMSQTETKIFLSDIYDKSIPDRIITIDGLIENMCNAEVQISEALRQSFKKDPHSMAPQYNLNPELPIMNPIDVNYSEDVFHSYQAFRPVQDLHHYSNSNYQLSAPIIQPQIIINTELHAIEPINTNYSINAFQINKQPYSSVQHFSAYSEVNSTFMDNNVNNNYLAQTTISNEGILMMNSTNINYSAPVFQIGHQPFPSAQCISYSKVTNTFMDNNVYNCNQAQTATISNQGLHMMNSTNTNYLTPVFQMGHHQFLPPAQYLSSYSEITNTFMDNNVNNNYHQAQNNFSNQGLHMTNSTNINYSAPESTQQYTSIYSNVTDPILDADYHDVLESVCLYIPVVSIKALIGISGSNINEMVKISGANIHVLPEKVENPIAPHHFCQKVIVSGIRNAQWKAQQMIFDKMWKEGYGPAFEEIILTVEIPLPYNQARNLVERDGSIISQMGKKMGCIIRMPKNETTNYTNYSPLHIIGGFIGTQFVQKSIRSILAA